MTPTQTRTLSERLAEGKLSAQEALRLGMSLAELLRKTHDAGIVDGGLTPARIELTSSGVELLPPGSQTGANPYTAPEVLRGKPADARADIFSFGAVLYEMLTGRVPFQGSTQQELLSSI